MDGVVVIGEGEKDAAPMLYCGEAIGDGSPPAVDIAVDPLDGTTLTAQVGGRGGGDGAGVWAQSGGGGWGWSGVCARGGAFRF